MLNLAEFNPHLESRNSDPDEAPCLQHGDTSHETRQKITLMTN